MSSMKSGRREALDGAHRKSRGFYGTELLVLLNPLTFSKTDNDGIHVDVVRCQFAANSASLRNDRAL